MWTSKRQRHPLFKVKVDSDEDVSAAAKLAAESVKIEKNEMIGEKWLTMKELFYTDFLDGVLVVYVLLFTSFIFFPGLFLQIPFWVVFLVPTAAGSSLVVVLPLFGGSAVTAISSESDWWFMFVGFQWCLCVSVVGSSDTRPLFP
ncbi:hypothetical protein MtrunA17_Chr2g0309061 [Medicago truncatula]|uniref:Transmembrane protein, putative n=1 Tax=Medicago truncatula TaxID=3880 RepID=A2Q3C4_MEDTR|nr:hypothetical protein MtrDRAFT_AC155880g24v2 [Medicago truncatula]AES66076.2 transmembrane protein, putative [Medicago truncatula]RHN74326.1 hypothetical protein MtrunA17_Chr2g0309061 [Medicago truncatula]